MLRPVLPTYLPPPSSIQNNAKLMEKLNSIIKGTEEDYTMDHSPSTLNSKDQQPATSSSRRKLEFSPWSIINTYLKMSHLK